MFSSAESLDSKAGGNLCCSSFWSTLSSRSSIRILMFSISEGVHWCGAGIVVCSVFVGVAGFLVTLLSGLEV